MATWWLRSRQGSHDRLPFWEDAKKNTCLIIMWNCCKQIIQELSEISSKLSINKLFVAHLPPKHHQWMNTKQVAQIMTGIIWAIEYVCYVYLLSFTNFSSLVSYFFFANSITYPPPIAPRPSPYSIQPLCHRCEPLLAGWQQVLLPDSSQGWQLI
jgi:hypothetical protein